MTLEHTTASRSHLWLLRRSLGLALLGLLALPGCASTRDDQGQAGAGKTPQPDPKSDTSGTQNQGGPRDTGDPKGESSKDKGEGDTDPGESDSESPEGQPKFDLGALPKEEKNKNKDDCDCEENADLIFLLAADGNVWTFDPVAKPDQAFKDLGKPGCDIPVGQHPFSMGVDRLAHGWMTIRSSGTQYKFDTSKPGSCKKTSFKPGTQGFKLYGMAFVEHPGDGKCDQLYLHSFDGTTPSEGKGSGTLGLMNPESLEVTKIGSIDFNGGELTGTGDGRLFAFAGKPGRLLEYDPKLAKVLKEIDLGNLELSSSFAFAFWGGDFYFFTDSLGTIPIKSKVTKLDYTGDGSVSTFTMAPIRVAGAGVSVCAPLEEPPPR